MKNIVLIDTNLYLDDADIIYKLAKEYDKVLIPLMVLKELDDKKYHKELSYSARKAIQAILDFSANNENKVEFDSQEYIKNTADERILASAKKYAATVATKDMSMSIQAKSLGLNSILHETVLNNIFNPYTHINVDDLHDSTLGYDFSYKDEYSDEESYNKTLLTFSEFNTKHLEKEYWWFAIIDTHTDNPIVYANNPIFNKIVRIDNTKKYREIRNEGNLIKARDAYQVCAIYALTEAPHTLLTGRWGSGKTLLATAHTLAQTRKKTFITRAPIGLDSRYDIGFLPGSLEDKMLDWLQGFMSALYFIYGNTRNDSKDGGTYDFVKSEIFPKKFEIMPINSIQGLSLLDNDTLIVDECQLINISYMSMILSRPSETGKLVLLGDIKQTYGVVKPSENGLLKLMRVLPHKYIAYVELKNSYRSPLLEVADKLQDKTLS
jgi:PhoH-like ATPase